jgi:hypothetical protein
MMMGIVAPPAGCGVLFADIHAQDDAKQGKHYTIQRKMTMKPPKHKQTNEGS